VTDQPQAPTHDQTGVTGERVSLGEINEPMLFFGGPCSNAESTEAMLDLVSREGFSPEHVVCTGDLAAYCADPAKTVSLIRDSGIHVVMGNCEESLGAALDDCGCGFDEGSSCDLLSVAWYRHAQSQLTQEDSNWMYALPRSLTFTMSDRKALVIHGSVSQINQFVFPSTDIAIKQSELEQSGAELVIGGHSGVPFTETLGPKLWHNPGIIGIPANDGTPRVWFSTMTPTDDGIRFEHRVLDYTYEKTARRIFDSKALPDDYGHALTSGLWPSDDVMPPADRDRRGRRIEEQSVVWTSH